MIPSRRKAKIRGIDLDLGHEELQTFLTVIDLRPDEDKECEELPVVRIISDRIPEEERSELEFVISIEVVNLDALRRIVSRGHLDGTLRAFVGKFNPFILGKLNFSYKPRACIS
ncbi:uncharacterized protein A4U43_C01F25870 [Asparagus officinalis]|uniref:Uncharacterized protein n=1 Tax=Asparagus officinalis TaxID=4686 RepID=A0A5P1FS55_ASPOF|nr:uncharacterized protein A4U43_C01F25870 [Asparagus officinalis]